MPESRRLKLIISYDGGDFAGWQAQANASSVQQSLEFTFRRICGEPIVMIGAGRTDAGVHAFGQCAHADVPAGRLAPGEWLKAANALLPPTVRVLRASFVSEHFHARFSAKEKIYRYRIITSLVLSPFEAGRAWHVAGPVDETILRQSANLFIGKHDFASFTAARAKGMERKTVRRISAVSVRRTGARIDLDFTAPGFLYKMVRMIVGAIIQSALGKEELDSVRSRLKRPGGSDRRFVAPAEGLYLVRVQY